MIPLRSSGGIAPTSVELLGNQAWDSSMALSILSFATVSSFSRVILPLSLLCLIDYGMERTARIANTIMGESSGSLNAEEDVQSQYCALGRGLIESIAGLSVSELAASVAKVCLIGTWRLSHFNQVKVFCVRRFFSCVQPIYTDRSNSLTVSAASIVTVLVEARLLISYTCLQTAEVLLTSGSAIPNAAATRQRYLSVTSIINADLTEEESNVYLGISRRI